MCVLPAHVCAPCACLVSTEDGARSPGTGVVDSCEPSYWCWEPVSSAKALCFHLLKDLFSFQHTLKFHKPPNYPKKSKGQRAGG